MRARGEIQPQGEGFELELRVDEGRGGERKLPARQCDQLGSAAAIALVLLLTSSASDEPRAGAEAQEGKPAPQLLPQPTEPSPKVDEADAAAGPPRTWRLLVAAPALALSVGPLPKPALGLGAGLGIAGESWSLRLLGQWSREQAVTAPIAGYGANVRRASAGLWACWDVERGVWSLSPCLEVSAAYLRATGYGPFLRPTTQSQMSLALGGGAIGRVRAREWLAFMLGVSVQAEVARPIILLRSVGPVRQLAPVSAVVQLGPEWIF